MFSNDMPVEVKYQLNIELRCKEYTGHNGICPMTVLNSFKLWLKQYEDLVECTKFELIPRLPEEDPYAEQRKWIGKLCLFSNGDGFDDVGYLTEIDPDMPEEKFRCNCHDYYKECKPVKPDDDIIYKGE